MRSPGDILLVSTYELGHQPLHLASPMGFLEAAGYAPRALDLAVEPLDEPAARQARFVGIAVPMHTALRLGLEVAARVRRLNPTAHLCFYGLYAPLNRAHLLSHGADSVIGGEFEVELVGLVRRLEAGDATAPAEVVLHKLAFAAPSRAALPPLEKYARLLTPDGEQLAGYVEASRGCLHLCRHCPIPPVYDGRFFVVQEAVVLDDIRRQVAAGARHITFGDPDFLNGPEHAMRIARALHRELPAITFDITAKIEHVLSHRALFPELRALGCLFVVSAVESLSPRVLEILDKGHTRADVELALDLTQAAGITLRPSLVPFTPWSTLEDYVELLEWIETRRLWDQLDPIHLAIRLLIPPGSKLLELEETRRAVGPLAGDRLTHTWRHADPRMDALQRSVMSIVDEAARVGEDPRATFDSIRSLVLAVVDGDEPPARAAVAATGARVRAPRLSEAWFC